MIIKIFILLIFSSYLYANEVSICNEVVRISSGEVVRNLDNIAESLGSILPRSCSLEKTPINLILEAIDEGDKDKFNKALDSLKENYIFKIMARVNPDKDLDKNQTQLEEFRKFLNEKFDVLVSRISKNERELLKSDPIKTFFVFYQYDKALNFIKKNDPQVYEEINTPYGKADALRHMFINALASRFGMSSFVKEFSTKRETSGGYIEYNEKSWREFNEKDFNRFHNYTFNELIKCNTKIDRSILEKIEHEKMLDKMIVNKMDIHNNQIGINLGKNNPCLSAAEIYKLVKKKYNSGASREIISAAGRCFDVSSNYDEMVATKETEDCILKHSEDLTKHRIRVPSHKDHSICL